MQEQSLNVGSFRAEKSRWKDGVDFVLSQLPSVYLYIELRRRWINWDKRLYLASVHRGDVVLDVGANVGTHTVFLSHLVGPRGRVLAFEPVAASFQQLEKNLRERARFGNVTPLRIALGASAGASTRTMQIPGDELTQAALVMHDADSWSGPVRVTIEQVSASTVDEQVGQLKLPQIDFIKVDVEGAELEVLQGARATVKRFKPLIYCEVYEKWAKTFGYSPPQLFSFLSSLGYGGARVFRGKEITAIAINSEFPRELFSTSADVLFFADTHIKRMNHFDRKFSVEVSSDATEGR